LFTKPLNYFVPISAGEYLLQKHQKCTANDITSVKKNTQNIPFACSVTKK